MSEKRKIAIMMTVHKNEEQTNRLINHLSEEFDIYVHIDKRSVLNIPNIEHVFVYKKYKVYWGSFNQILATLLLMKQAYIKNYERYIFISGQDLPIKTNKEITDFFEGNNKEYISGKKLPISNIAGNGGFDRVTKYWPNQLPLGRSFIQDNLFKIKAKFFEIFSEIKQRPIDYEFYKGTNWFNFTHDCVKKIIIYLDKHPEYLKRFKHTTCADEIFYHTIINIIEGLHIENENLRYINWIDGPEFPRTLRTDDFEKIISSNKLFARKFDDGVNNQIIDILYDTLDKNKRN